MINIAYRLKESRLHLRMAYDDVEAVTDINANQVYRLETGSQHFHVDSIVPLAECYHQPINYYFRNYERFPTPSEIHHLETMQKQLNRYLKSRKKLVPDTGVQLVLFKYFEKTNSKFKVGDKVVSVFSNGAEAMRVTELRYEAGAFRGLVVCILWNGKGWVYKGFRQEELRYALE